MLYWVWTCQQDTCSPVQFTCPISLWWYITITEFLGLNRRSLSNGRCKKVCYDISVFLGYWNQEDKFAYLVQCILQQTLCIFKLSHVHVCNGLAIEQHDSRSVFVRKLLENVVRILIFLSTLWWKEISGVDYNTVHVIHTSTVLYQFLTRTLLHAVYGKQNPYSKWHYINLHKKHNFHVHTPYIMHSLQ